MPIKANYWLMVFRQTLEKTGSLVSELLYKEEKLQQKTFYYPNGNKQMLISGNEKWLNGEFKIWYPNSQLNFSGNYKYNLKDGEFQQIDENGKACKKRRLFWRKTHFRRGCGSGYNL